MIITYLGLTFGTPIGLNDTRKSKLVKEFAGEYPNTGVVGPGGFFALFKDTIPSERIFFSDNDFTLAIEKPDVQPDFDAIDRSIQKVFDVLALDPPSIGVCRIMAVEQTETNTMDYSLAHFQSAEMAKAIAGMGVTGVGLRYVTAHDGMWSEFKVEPRLPNDKEIFFELMDNMPKADLNTMLSKMRETFRSFGNNYVETLRKAGCIPARR